MKNDNTKPAKNSEPSKELLEEFGLISSGKEKLADKVGKPGEYANNQNSPGLVEEFMNQYGAIVDERDPLFNKKAQGNMGKDS